MKFKANYAAYKNLFYPLIKASAFTTTTSKDEMQDTVPFSAGPFKIQSWSPEQEVLVPNTAFWDKTTTPLVDKIVFVPETDSDTEINALLSGQVDAIFPQPSAGIDQRLNDPNIKFTFGLGTQYENLWIQQKTGPFSDPILRQAFVAVGRHAEDHRHHLQADRPRREAERLHGVGAHDRPVVRSEPEPEPLQP